MEAPLLLNIFIKFGISIRNSPLMYKAFLLFMGKYKTNLFPNKKTDVHITGYPRSGNTYAKNLMVNLVDSINIATHVHSIATIKDAFKYKVPIVVLIRNPNDCIPSDVLKRRAARSGLLNEVRSSLLEYLNYYSFVKKHINRLEVLDFKFLIQDPVYLTSLIKDQIDPQKVFFSPERLLNAKYLSEKKLKSDKRPPEQNMWYSSKKESLKKEVLEQLVKLPEYHQATALYISIVEKKRH